MRTFAEWQADKGIRPWVVVQGRPSEPWYVVKIHMRFMVAMIWRGFKPVMEAMARVMSNAAEAIHSFSVAWGIS